MLTQEKKFALTGENFCSLHREQKKQEKNRLNNTPISRKKYQKKKMKL
ncbi:hypothetical protein PORCRE_1726 [Porphyromonas crevioricanis JCM 15906]|uniref:Uncharacterized protein n=1 Tax=Porphyromonas crevioricanis JCM 15906 TaxID=1305617 RepID=T1CIM6_9PORP|nr:hypothetical protein PORCRE_1726 [Porphyromonas crevioricanis JCM 15906]